MATISTKTKGVKAYTEATSKLLKPLALKHTDRLHISVTKDLSKFHCSIQCEGDETPSYDALYEFPKRIPERKELKDFHTRHVTWQFASSDYTVQVIKGLWPADQLVFDDDAKIVYEYLDKTIEMQERAAENYAAYKETGVVPQHDLELHWDCPLSPYQQVAALNSYISEGYGLFMDPGTGKTCVTISRIMTAARDKRKKTGKPFKAIIVVPKQVRQNWVNEFHKFATLPGKVTILKGGQLARVKLLIEAMTFDDDDAYTVVIVSYETMVQSWKALKLIEWDLAVADEAHMFKSHKTRRWQFMQELRDVSAARMPLTGSPIANSPLDLYCLFEFMGKGWSGFSSCEEWRDFYGVFVKDDNSGHDKLVGCQNLPFLQERLTRLSYRVTKKEAMPYLPDKMYDIEEVEMVGEQADIYKQVATQLAAEIEDELDSSENKSLTINNVLTKLLRLAQITSGYVTWDAVYDPATGEELKPKKVEYFKKNPKIDLLLEELQRREINEPNSKTIVWSCWIPNIKQISAELTKAGIKHVTFYGGTNDKDRLEAERQFNCDPTCRVFVGNPAAGGVGLNLLGFDPNNPTAYETNCDWVVYFSQNWSAIIRGQSEDRANRRGTRVPTRITDLCVPESIDEQIRVRVLGKLEMAMKVNDVREILKNVLNGLNLDISL